MPTKKKSKNAVKKKSKAVRKAIAAKRVTLKKKTKRSAKSGVKAVARKSVAKLGTAKKASVKKQVAKKAQNNKVRGKADQVGSLTFENTGLGARTGGQSGDTQGLSGVAETDSESVKELLEEGQSFEAEVLEGVENVPDADKGEIRTREIPEDDVPEEYLGKD
jgi:hypothetical protein